MSNSHSSDPRRNTIDEERSELPTQSIKAEEKDSPPIESKYLVTPPRGSSSGDISQMEKLKEMKTFLEQNMHKDYEKLMSINQTLKSGKESKGSVESMFLY
jgi:hypothetical protein